MFWTVWGQCWDISNTISSPKLIFQYQILTNSYPKMVDFRFFKAFISNSLTKALQMLKSAYFHTKSSQICQWKIDFHNPTMSTMVQTCPNRSQTSKLIIRNTFWTSKSDIRVGSSWKNFMNPPLKNKFPNVDKNFKTSKFQNCKVSKFNNFKI